MKNRLLFWGLTIIAILTVILVFAYPRIQSARAQEDFITNLYTRLEQAGVKGVSINFKESSPSFPEITIQRNSGKDELSADDLIALHTTEREAIYSYQFGFHLNGYTLITINPDGSRASWEQASVNEDEIINKSNPFVSAVADDSATKELIEDNLNVMGFNLDSVNVKTGVGSSKDVQLAEISLSIDDLDSINRDARGFLESIRPLITQLNKESGVRIAVVFVNIKEGNGNPLLEYLWDVQLDIVRSKTTYGVQPWYSEPPAPGDDTTIPTATTPRQATVPPSNPLTYPPPGGTPYP